jgi:hypothetical protein
MSQTPGYLLPKLEIFKAEIFYQFIISWLRASINDLQVSCEVILVGPSNTWKLGSNTSFITMGLMELASTNWILSFSSLKKRIC